MNASKEDPITAAKQRVARCKTRVMQLQAQVAEAKTHSAIHPRVIRQYKRDHETALTDLRDAKIALAAMGPSSSPVESLARRGGKWGLIADAHAILSRLEDAGIDISESGRELLEEIEFHIAAAVLDGAAERLIAKEKGRGDQ